MSHSLSIFTPTYNRKAQLVAVYESLLGQTDKNFIWLVIDDGSTDGTEEEVLRWERQKKIKIDYFRKTNGGKHSAYNYMLDKVRTDYVFIALDSDDKMPDKAVETVHALLDNNKDCDGIVGLARYENGVKYCDIEKNNGRSLSDVISEGKLKTETAIIVKTSYLKQFRYPEIKGEKFVSEALTYIKMNKPFVWTNSVLRESAYRKDGLTKNMISLYVNNPISWLHYQKIRYESTKKFLLKIKCALSKETFEAMTHSHGKKDFLSTIMYPAGWLRCKYILYKYSRNSKGKQE